MQCFAVVIPMDRHRQRIRDEASVKHSRRALSGFAHRSPSGRGILLDGRQLPRIPIHLQIERSTSSRQRRCDNHVPAPSRTAAIPNPQGNPFHCNRQFSPWPRLYHGLSQRQPPPFDEPTSPASTRPGMPSALFPVIQSMARDHFRPCRRLTLALLISKVCP